MKKKAQRFLTLSVAGLLCATSATQISAQSVPGGVTGSHINRKESGATGAFTARHQGSSRAAFNAYARCAAELFSPLARRVLAQPFGTAQQENAVENVTRFLGNRSEECFSAAGIRVQASSLSFTGAFAEHFIEHAFIKSDVERMIADDTPEWSSSRPAPSNANERFGACVVQTSALAIHDLALSVPDSRSETAALTAIVPALSPCIVQGQEVKFDRSSLRSILSVALYRALESHQTFLKASA